MKTWRQFCLRKKKKQKKTREVSVSLRARNEFTFVEMCQKHKENLSNPSIFQNCQIKRARAIIASFLSQRAQYKQVILEVFFIVNPLLTIIGHDSWILALFFRENLPISSHFDLTIA